MCARGCFFQQFSIGIWNCGILFIFNVTLVLIIRYYCFSDWFNQVNIICDHVHIDCIIDARLQLAYETLQHITIGQRRGEHGENC